MLHGLPAYPRRRLIGPSTNIKRSCIVSGQKTSISLEDRFWKGLRDLATSRGVLITSLLTEIDADRPKNSTLSSAVRVYVLDELRRRHDMLAALVWG